MAGKKNAPGRTSAPDQASTTAATPKERARCEREARLAAALRDNLRRRKAQSRGRRGGGGPGPA